MRTSLLVLGLGLAACGDNDRPPLAYTDPHGGALRLIANPASTSTELVLDLVVGDQPLTGYAVGFDLPVAPRAIALTAFAPGRALDPGRAPIAAKGALPTTGPLANVLVTGQSQKAAGDGAIATDTVLAPGTALYTIRLAKVAGAAHGVVFDGTASEFVLPSGGLRDRAGATVVAAKDVAIGKLEITR